MDAVKMWRDPTLEELKELQAMNVIDSRWNLVIHLLEQNRSLHEKLHGF